MIKALGYTVAVSRAVFGAGYIAAPSRVSQAWIGKTAKLPATDVLSRAVGARDLALGGGAAVALATGGRPRIWFAAQAIADCVDFGATLAAGRRLPADGKRLGLLLAGGSAIAAAAVAAGLGDESPQSGLGSDAAPSASTVSTTPRS